MTTGRLTAEERLDVQELFARYCWGLNTGDIEQVLSCFTPDGYLSHPPQGRCQGEAGIRALLDELWYSRTKPFIGRQHLANHFLFSREDEGVRVKAYWTIAQKEIETGRTLIYALCHWDNLCVRDGGRWLFRALEVTVWDKGTIPWVGGEAGSREGA